MSMFVVFDLDGTLADIRHRVHHVRDGKRDWEAFFAACPDDAPNWPVIETLKAHEDAMHRVEIWSGRSDQVRAETEDWLDRYGIDPCRLTRMRAQGDTSPDVRLKRYWLHSLSESEWPDAIYDDRKRIVEMWREEGVPCFQVAPGDWDDGEGRILPPTHDPLLHILIGPTGAGKSYYKAENYSPEWCVSSDELRTELTGSFEDQSRNDDVFLALHRIAKARLVSGLPAVIDATNLRQKDRIACASLAPAGASIAYVVIDRPMKEKVRDGGWRNEITHKKSGLPLLELHEQRFQAQLPNILKGDGLPNVTVLDRRKTEKGAA